ncbi:MAG TPA: hypothetical protein GX717_04325 [Clostridiaceae bacterium]|nr:hypothetical protein [Clostridiaceae bacterium]
MNFLILADTGSNVFSPENMAGYFATAIVTIIGFIITVVILKKLLYKPVLKVVHKRQAQVEEQLKQAQEVSDAVEGREKQVQAQMDEAKEKVRLLLATAQKQAEQQKQTIVAEAEAEAERIIERSNKEAARRRDLEDELIYTEAVKLAVATVKKYIVAEVRAGVAPAAVIVGNASDANAQLDEAAISAKMAALVKQEQAAAVDNAEGAAPTDEEG